MLVKNVNKFFLLLGVTALAAYSMSADSAATPRSSGDRIVLTAGQIKEMNVQSIPELLNRLPGITAGETYVKIQGAYNVRVLLDNRPINDPSSSHGGIKWNMVSIHDIERIEILMGGGAAAIGDGTSGGAIVLTSKKNDAAHGHVELAGGNFSTEDLCFRFGQTVGPLTMGASAGYSYTDGHRVNGDKTRKRAGARVGVNGENANAAVSVDYGTDDRGHPGKPQWPTPAARAFAETIIAALNGHSPVIDGSIYFSKDTKTTDNPERPLETMFDGLFAGAKATRGFELGKLGPLATGIEGEYEYAEGFRKALGSADTLETWDYSEAESRAGVWASKALPIPMDRAPMSINAGLRFNYYSAFPVNLNPELRVRISPWKLSLNAGVAVMHNAPNLRKRYYESSSTTRNPNLEPERGINTALGIGYTDTKRTTAANLGFSCGAQGYYNFIDDRITYVTSATSSMGQYQNLGHVVRRGVDLSAGVKVDSLLTALDISLDASLGILDARDLDTDLYLTGSPGLRAKATAAVKAFRIVSLRMIGEYTGKQYTTTDNLTVSDPYFIVDGNLDVEIKRVVLYCSVENVFDIDYAYSDGYSGAPREYVVGVRCEF